MVPQCRITIRVQLQHSTEGNPGTTGDLNSVNHVGLGGCRSSNRAVRT